MRLYHYVFCLYLPQFLKLSTKFLNSCIFEKKKKKKNIHKIYTCEISAYTYLFVAWYHIVFTILHCVKSVRLRSFSGSYFPAFGLNTERYGVFLRIQPECGKIRTRIILNTGSLTAVFTAWKASKYGVFSGPYFPAFGLNTERYFVSLCIRSECGKIRTRKNSVFGHFSRSVASSVLASW